MFTARLTSVLTTLLIEAPKNSFPTITGAGGCLTLILPSERFNALFRVTLVCPLFACYTCRFEHFPHVAWRCEAVLLCVRFALCLSLPSRRQERVFLLVVDCGLQSRMAEDLCRQLVEERR